MQSSGGWWDERVDFANLPGSPTSAQVVTDFWNDLGQQVNADRAAAAEMTAWLDGGNAPVAARIATSEFCAACHPLDLARAPSGYDPFAEIGRGVVDAGRYVGTAAKQLLLGDWTEANNGLGTALQIGGQLTGLDAIADARDLTASVHQFDWTWAGVGRIGLNAAAMLPVVGIIKPVAKQADDAVDAAKTAAAVSALPAAIERIHGNSLASPRTAHLYRLEDAEGNFLKWGVTQDLGKRYPQSFLLRHRIAEVARGMRADIIHVERGLVETQPGPLNFERWAGFRLGGQP